MSDMPSNLIRGMFEATGGPRQSPAVPPRTIRPAWMLGCLAASAGLAVLGCLGSRPARPWQDSSGTYPPEPQPPRVIALGTLRGSTPPSRAQIELAQFLFGTDPPAPLTLAKPSALAVSGEELLICDPAPDMLWRWDLVAGKMTPEPTPGGWEAPQAIDVMPNGDRLVIDRAGVRRIDSGGRARCTYARDRNFKPADVLSVGDEVWVTNLAGHCIDVFDADTGQQRRSIGEHGHGAGQFALPRGLARTPGGDVCVVDMLNDRVQVLDAQGRFVRSVGRAGDSVGCFGRPKDVAVGPDGTIFVTDAFSQRVHVFAPDGYPLLAFGEPGSGIGELTLPSGIAISTVAPRVDRAPPPGLTPAYFVLVADQLNRPGIRVYAWLGAGQAGSAGGSSGGIALNWRPTFPQSTAINPHWDPQRCTKCHPSEAGRMLPISLPTTDALCISCHDGTQAPADPHPIGRPAHTELVITPEVFPTIGGAIGCLTCHDIQRHCDPQARRPAVNAVLLREYDPQRALEYCGNCHRSEQGGRFSPHRQRDATGKVREDACLFCHTQRPLVPSDGRRRFEPHLRVESSDLCLNCHSRHWDLSPLGHVDRPVTPRIREWMLVTELSRENEASLDQLAQLAAQPHRQPARLPLGSGRVTCYTCHNPHYTGLFPANSELGALAENPQDRRSALRTDWVDLCSECHHR